MKQKHYTEEERRRHIALIHERKDKDPGYSIRRYASENGIRYYTLRDWWRSPETNPRWNERYPECPEASAMNLKDGGGEPLVMIGVR